MSGASILRLDTAELGAREAELRAMFDEAWADEGGFDDDEWAHAIGGAHFVLEAATAGSARTSPWWNDRSRRTAGRCGRATSRRSRPGGPIVGAATRAR